MHCDRIIDHQPSQSFPLNKRMYEPNRIVVLLSAFLMAVLAGCESQQHSVVPVPIDTEPPYSYEGRIGRIWGGDNFEVVDESKVHYAFIRGIDTPEPGQTWFNESCQKLRELARHKTAVINVHERDPWKREECELTIKDPETGETIEPAMKLLEGGLAWFDQSDGPWAEEYRKAEERARKEKIGIWSEPNPIPPWEFWESLLDEIQDGPAN